MDASRDVGLVEHLGAWRSPPAHGPLRPHPWHPGDPPPPPPGPTPHPLLLLINRRDPLATAGHDALLDILTAAERQRHVAYRRPADQQRFLVARAALRQLLGHWLERPPTAVAIEIGPYGKPHCAGAPAFNLSHSGDLILLAFHRDSEVGVDVERVRPDLDWLAIARRVFPSGQTAALEGLPAGEQLEAFLWAWCRLEARLKARGEGLAGLERLRSPGPAGEAAGAEPLEAETLWDVDVPPGYAAAVALATRLRAPAVVAGGACPANPPL
jgi:4'-phosphopantetheinyl transferase